jgi:hypothetical protein
MATRDLTTATLTISSSVTAVSSSILRFLTIALYLMMFVSSKTVGFPDTGGGSCNGHEVESDSTLKNRDQ